MIILLVLLRTVALIVLVFIFLFLQELLVAVVADNIGSTGFALELLALIDGHSISAVVTTPVSLRINGMMIAASF